jgi:hypothetical protein
MTTRKKMLPSIGTHSMFYSRGGALCSSIAQSEKLAKHVTGNLANSFKIYNFEGNYKRKELVKPRSTHSF